MNMTAMTRFWLLCAVLCCAFLLVFGGDMGPGVWQVNHIKKCEEQFHKFKFDIKQKKINRTHDGFNGDLILNEEFTADYGVRIDICKNMDGGCKPFQMLTDDCFVNFVNKYAEGNVKAALEKAGVDPPEFPVQKGEYHINEYIFNYDELPDDGIYGSYCAKAYVLKGSEEVGCVECHVEFKEVEDDDEDDKKK